MKSRFNSLTVAFSIALSLSVFRVSAQQSDAVLGVWYTEGKESKVEISKQNGKYTGRIIWLGRTNPDGSPITDTKNPDEKLRSRKVQGLQIMKDFTYAGKNVWEDGEIYDPKSGKTYSCKMTLANAKQLDVRGYVGISLIGRTTRWERAE